jgi:hypothetical protein
MILFSRTKLVAKLNSPPSLRIDAYSSPLICCHLEFYHHQPLLELFLKWHNVVRVKVNQNIIYHNYCASSRICSQEDLRDPASRVCVLLAVHAVSISIKEWRGGECDDTGLFSNNVAMCKLTTSTASSNSSLFQ